MKRVFWLYGLPSSGKTTLATALRDHFQAAGRQVLLLDGDDLRSGLCADLGFSDADRSENLRRAAHLAKLAADQGNSVVCAFVTPKEHHREQVQRILGEQVQFIHIDCPLEACVARDVKGLYAKAAANQMTSMSGTQDAFESPKVPGKTVPTHLLSVGESVQTLLSIVQGS
jgi:adenylyl-sulfate kinase